MVNLATRNVLLSLGFLVLLARESHSSKVDDNGYSIDHKISCSVTFYARQAWQGDTVEIEDDERSFDFSPQSWITRGDCEYVVRYSRTRRIKIRQARKVVLSGNSNSTSITWTGWRKGYLLRSVVNKNMASKKVPVTTTMTNAVDVDTTTESILNVDTTTESILNADTTDIVLDAEPTVIYENEIPSPIVSSSNAKHLTFCFCLWELALYSFIMQIFFYL